MAWNACIANEPADIRRAPAGARNQTGHPKTQHRVRRSRRGHRKDPDMNIADAINPFVFEYKTEPGKDQNRQIVSAGQITIYSVEDQITLSSSASLAQYASVVADEYDLVVYGLDVTIAGNLGNSNRGSAASRNISIFCRTLEIIGSADPNDPVIIDASGTLDDALSTHIQPDIKKISLAANTKGANGDDIAYALNNPSANNPYTNWFATNPGKGWGTKGTTGGTIKIACETLILHNKLSLKANGGQGNAGVSGQDVQNWFPGNVGGDAGQGGSGGDSGTISMVCNQVKAIVNGEQVDVAASEWVILECDAGPDGDPGQPGSAYEPERQYSHLGNQADSPESGDSNEADLIVPDAIDYNAAHSGDPPDMRKVADLSMIASQCNPHYWSLMYHRAKIEYLKRQPMAYEMPSAIDPSWVALGDIMGWCWRFSFAYGDTRTSPNNNYIADVADDPDADGKDPIARAMKLMQTWYLGGKTMWGHDVATVDAMPLDTIIACIDSYYPDQIAVRDFYIKLRIQLADAIKSSADLTTMSNAAGYAVAMHQATYDSLKKYLFGGSDQSDGSLLTQLSSAATDVNAAIADLAPDIAALDGPIQSAVGIKASDVLGAISSMAFVIADPPAFAVMGAAEGLGLYDKAVNNVLDDSGNPQSKTAVIQQLHNLKGNVGDLKTLMSNMAGNDQVGKLDAAVLTSLDNIDSYVSQFTQALGDIGQTVLDKVAELRGKINHRNDLWLDYNDRLYQLAKEWDDLQAAKAKKADIDSTENPISADLINAVQIYTGVYLNNIERTADLWARLLRKYAYTTLSAPFDDNSFVVGEGSMTAFWSAEQTAAQSLADQANANFDVQKGEYVGTTSVVRLQLAQYEAGSQTVVLQAPSAEAAGKKSDYYISIRGDGTEQDQTIIRTLLKKQVVWLQVVPGMKPVYKPTTKAPTLQTQYPLISNNNWDERITHVNPWIEGIRTDTGKVGFHVKLGAKAYIMDASGSARFFDYQTGVNSDFDHYTDAVLSDETNDRMAGGGDGLVEGQYIDRRGIYTLLQIAIPDSTLNAGLAPQTDISKVNIRVYFSVIFRAAR
jgi:hypothetical protein